MAMFKVLLIGGSTGTMLEALQVVGDSNRYRQLYEVSSFAVYNCHPPALAPGSGSLQKFTLIVICIENYEHIRDCDHHACCGFTLVLTERSLMLSKAIYSSILLVFNFAYHECYWLFLYYKWLACLVDAGEF